MKYIGSENWKKQVYADQIGVNLIIILTLIV